MSETPDTPYQAFLDGRLSRYAFQLHRAFQKFANRGRVCFPANRTLRAEMAAAGVVVANDGNLRRLKRELVQAGFLVVNQVYTAIGRQTSNFYRLTAPARKTRAVPMPPAEAQIAVTNPGRRRRIPGRKDGAFLASGLRPGEEVKIDLPSYELRRTERRKTPYSPPNTENYDPETAPELTGVSPGPPGPSSEVQSVLEGMKKINGAKEMGGWTAGALAGLQVMVNRYTAGGILAGYRLWHEPGKPWSKWATKTEYSLGALFHEYTWPKIVDDASWARLKAKYNGDLEREAGFTFSTFARILSDGARAGP